VINIQQFTLEILKVFQACKQLTWNTSQYTYDELT